MNHVIKTKCCNCEKDYEYHLSINGFKSINNGTATVAVVPDTKPIASCPFCDHINHFKYMNSMSAHCTYVEVPRLLTEDDPWSR